MENSVLEFLPKHIMSKYIRHQVLTKPFDDLKYDQFESAINTQMIKEASVEQQEFLYVYTEKCIIEPTFGWALSENFKLIAESYPYAQFVLDQFKPSITKNDYFRQKKITLNKAVLLSENYTNYFHFLNDFVGRLALLDRLNVSRDIPVIVSEKLRSSIFFQQFNTLCPKFFNRNWIFQATNEYYEIEDATYFVQNITCKHENFRSLLDELPHEKNAVASPGKIFITRRGIYGRGLINSLEIENIARNNNFKIIDAQNFTIAEQVKLFTNATHIIGLHGAGLMNMIYCKNKHIKILELFPGNFYKAVYYWLASQFSYSYDCIRGLPTTDNEQTITSTSVIFKSNFYLPPDIFLNKLIAWLK
ncbi:hypothetical protein ATO12_15790 [Aquimarina atlantica]|uniref:Glycosyltransferase 61 catalytic domain-containing protein n=1 Tax=Aquimarina atlantica TaxID=1317122 RepID=A0A023BTU1_9FLAO|nr:glycosyltransferase family 61 protein [Aquimarina atlantica]EZH73400.1 hypothetical protein ATO12_15790 [Aquimarina atlantica]